MGGARWVLALVLGGTASMSVAGGIPFGESRATPLYGGHETAPLIQTSAVGAMVQNGQGSLFAGTAEGGLLAPYPARVRRGQAPGLLPAGPLRSGVAGLKGLIARAEAGPDGYDAVVWSARIKPPKPPTRMTLAEIFAWIEATPGQNHAIGRYQFIPKTLRWLVARAGLSLQARFSPQLQDQLAQMLLQDAGLQAFLAGELPRTAFMNNLARTWAGLPTQTGRSHYHGLAGNKATMSWDDFETQMAHLFPPG